MRDITKFAPLSNGIARGLQLITSEMGPLMQNLLMTVKAILFVPNLRLIVIAVLLVVVASALSKRMWVHFFVAILLLVASTVISVWVLQLGWVLAAVGT